MELTPAQLVALQTLTVAANKLPTDRLSVGQQLLATIIATDAKAGEVVLNINNAILNAKTSLPLKVNQTLQLLVAQTGNQVTLKLQDNALHTLITEQAMRQVLPQQQPINVAVRHIQQILQQRPSTSIPPRLIQLANQFVKQLPTVQQLSSAEGIKSAFVNSGLFLEKNLKRMVDHQPAVNLKRDIKSLFINLKQALAQQKPTTENTNSRQENTATTKQTPPASTSLPQRIIVTIPEKTPTKTQTPSPPASQPPVNNSGQTKLLKTDTSVTAIKNIAPTSQPKNIEQITKIPEHPRQPLANNVTLVAAKFFTQQAKSIPQTLNNTNTQSPPPLPTIPTAPTPSQSLAVQQHQLKLNTSYQHSSHNPAKQALEFVATKPEAKQPATAMRFNTLADVIENLVKAVDSAISRTQLHQLHTLHEQENGKLVWSFEIPVRDDEEIHLVQMQLEKEQKNNEDKDAMVSVNLAIELEALGPIHARITLASENISVVLWAEHETTFDLAAAHLDELQENLRKSGFTAENISCHQGTPPTPPRQDNPSSENLVDLKA